MVNKLNNKQTEDMLWINFLHIYQPQPLIKSFWLKSPKDLIQILFEFLKQNKKHKITLNITGCLTEYLNQVGLQN